ncbi:MAG: SMP-30/gluconolactonase/LRE family protein [Myxococcales bacterium]|nr:MAG: SMP-30/gluconolactonase/LRE family protein [Myxococcales bacterium]
MKTAWLGLATLTFVWACGGDGGTGQPPNTAGTSGGGSGNAGTPATGGSGTSGSGTAAGTSAGGSGTSGSVTGGSTSGGSGTGGSGGSGSGTGGSGGSGGSAPSSVCPAGPFDAPVFGTPVRVEGVPPADAFNNMNNDFTNIEGAVWVGDALYVSEISGKGNNPPPSRILKITADGTVTVAVPDSGTNGLAINAAGELFGAKHSDGSISKIALPGGTATPVASMYMGKRFGSPNDLTIHSNGTIYFTDPSWQAPMPNPQTETRAYIVKPGGMPEPIAGQFSQPNGITLSKNQDFLYVGGNQLRKYPVMADGSLGAGTEFVAGGGSDGMVLDCADNLYITKDGVQIYDKTGQKIGATLTVGMGGTQVTNVAFGGADRKTLYVTGQGSGMQKGLFKVPMNVPGYPY